MATKKTDTIPATPTPEPKVRRAAKAKAETLVSDPATRAGKLRPPAPPEPSLMDEKEDPRDLIDRALKTLKSTLRDRTGATKFESDENVHDYLRLKIGHIEDREVFGVIWLDGQGTIIEDVMLAEGGLTETHISLKRVLRSAMDFNAHAGIIYHNHPSGYADPSDNDIKLTERLGSMLGLLEIELVDHYIVGCDAELTVGSVKEYVAEKEKEREQEQRAHLRELRRMGIDVPDGARLPEGLLRILKMMRGL